MNNKYTVKEAAQKVNAVVHTLRYYDKIGLISPTRESNNYRYYSDEDILLLKHVQVMKYANFSLEEINILINSRKNVEASCQNSENVLGFLDLKREEIIKQIENLNKIELLITSVRQMISNSDASNVCRVDDLVLSIFDNCKEVIK